MDFYIGYRINKNEKNASEIYSGMADWCNNSELHPDQQVTIEDKGKYYEIVEVVITLEEIKQNKICELKAMRDKIEDDPITTNKGTFDYDQKARERIQGMVNVLEDSDSLKWTLADNSTATVTKSDLKELILLACLRSNALHNNYTRLKKIVENAKAKEDIQTIYWDISN